MKILFEFHFERLNYIFHFYQNNFIKMINLINNYEFNFFIFLTKNLFYIITRLILMIFKIFLN